MQKQTLFVVKAFGREGGRLTQAETIQYESERRARSHGKHLRAKRAGVVVYQVSAVPEADCWDEPQVLEMYGAAPAE